MSIRITNLKSVPFTLPAPIAVELAVGETRTFDDYSATDLAANPRFEVLRSGGIIAIENLLDVRPKVDGTVADLDIWVDGSTGSDFSGDGSEDSPYATLTKAMEDVPEKINHIVHIRIGAGNYTETISNISHSYGGNGMLAIEGIGTPAAVSGPYTVTAWGADTSANSCCSYITVSGTPWAADDLWGKWVRVTGGTGVGRVFPVFTNTTDTIRFHTVTAANVGTVTEIEIIDGPATTLEFEHGLICSSPQLNQIGEYHAGHDANASRLLIAGIRLKTDVVGSYQFTFFNTCAMLQFVAVETPSPSELAWTYTLYIQNSIVNIFYPVVSGVLDNPLLEDEDGGGVMSVRGTSPWTGGFASSATIDNSRIGRLTDRLTVYIWNKVSMDESCLGHITAQQATLWIDRVYLDAVNDGSTSRAISLMGGWFDTYRVYVEKVNGDYAISVAENAFAKLYNVKGNSANIAGYGIRISSMSRVFRYTDTTITGVTNDIYFDQPTVPLARAWPAADNSDTDSLGSLVVTA